MFGFFRKEEVKEVDGLLEKKIAAMVEKRHKKRELRVLVKEILCRRVQE